MPRQNRVNPFGEIMAIPARGAWTGNRGCLHDAEGRLGRARWRSPAWIVCRLDYKGWRRPIMAPGRWTELFFLDEATALAAGHRPCALCRRADYRRFAALLAPDFGGTPPKAPDLDRRLHAERLDGRAKRMHPIPLALLPDGALLSRTDGDGAWLRWQGALHRWTPGGYDRREAMPDAARVLSLTPPTTLAALRAGYRPEIHPSVRPSRRA